jgi:hypothetical protein
MFTLFNFISMSTDMGTCRLHFTNAINHHPDDGGSTRLWNIGQHQLDYTALHLNFIFAAVRTWNLSWSDLFRFVSKDSGNSRKFSTDFQTGYVSNACQTRYCWGNPLFQWRDNCHLSTTGLHRSDWFCSQRLHSLILSLLKKCVRIMRSQRQTVFLLDKHM